ncbi:MAG: sensor histidine kinase [Spirochaetaceae bacterium]
MPHIFYFSEQEKERRLLYLESILAAVPDAVITLDERHHVVEWNPAAERLFGYTSSEAVGRNLDDLVAPAGSSSREEAQTITKLVLNQQTVPYTEAVRYRRDGSPVEVVLSGAPIVSEGQTIGVVATYKDISAQKAAEREIRKLLEEKKLLLEEAHHRIKNDLFLIRSMLSLQARKAPEEAARQAIEQAGRRVAVIGEMYQSLYQDGGSQWVPLSVALERTLSEPRSEAEWIHFSLAADPGEVAARPAVAIGIVVNELVTNSLKHAARGSDESKPGITISLDARRGERDFLILTVRDTGPGYPEAVLRGAKTGLGLEMVASLAEQYDGSLELRNENGGVATVTLEVTWRENQTEG